MIMKISMHLAAWLLMSYAPLAVQAATYSLTSLCGRNNDVTIPSDSNQYVIDGDADCGLLTIVGKLKCDPGVNAIVQTKGIKLDGSNSWLECGSRTSSFTGNIVFEFTDDESFSSSTGERSFVVDGGTVSLWGDDSKKEYTRLTADAAKNVNLLDLYDNSGWVQGDQIMISTTSTYPDQTEEKTVDNCVSTTCTLSSVLNFFHYGNAVQTYTGAGESNEDLVVDQRAYVANLNRNIVFRGADDTHWASNEKGGHMIILEGSSIYIDNVKFERMGQKGILGRYPIHFHHAGNVNQQFVVNSVIHNSASRCIALHNTHKVKIDNNVCYKVRGHAILLEEGNEVENIITNNLISDVIEPASGDELLLTDRDIQLSRWRGPAGIWVSNPGNEIENNVVINAGSGFWHAYVHKLYCYDDPNNKSGTTNSNYGKYCDYIPRTQSWGYNVQPNDANTLVYKDNTAISCRVGHTWDGAPDGTQVPSSSNPFNRETVTTGYSPSSPQLFDGMHAYKSQKTGIYYRGLAHTALIRNAVIAEAPIGWFGTGDQDFFDSVFVGVSATYRGSDPGDQDWNYHVDTNFPGVDRGGTNKLWMGWGLYDGSNHFKHVTFDYPTNPMYLNTKEITPTPITIFGRGHFANHILEDITFSPQDPYRKISLDDINFGNNWKDTMASESLYDIDGSLFGTPGFIRPDLDFNNGPGCTRTPNPIADADLSTPASAVLLCGLPTTSVKIQMDHNHPDDDFQNFKVVNNDNGASVQNPSAGALFDKFQVYDDILYWVKDLDFKSEDNGNLIWIETQSLGNWTPAIIIEGSSATNFAAGCSQASDYELLIYPGAPTGQIHQASTITEFRNFNDPQYVGVFLQLDQQNQLILKLKGFASLAGNPNQYQPQAEGKFNLVCPLP